MASESTQVPQNVTSDDNVVNVIQSTNVDVPTVDVPSDVPVVKEVIEQTNVGDVVGQCKWFSDKLGYGFITIQSGDNKGKDIFVHHSGIKPLNSNYKTLRKGEYVNFNLVDGENGLQAINVTGIGGGSLMCDVVPSVKFAGGLSTATNTPTMPVSVPSTPRGTSAPRPERGGYSGDGEFRTVSYRRVPPTGGRGSMGRTNPTFVQSRGGGRGGRGGGRQ